MRPERGVAIVLTITLLAWLATLIGVFLAVVPIYDGILWTIASAVIAFVSAKIAGVIVYVVFMLVGSVLAAWLL